MIINGFIRKQNTVSSEIWFPLFLWIYFTVDEIIADSKIIVTQGIFSEVVLIISTDSLVVTETSDSSTLVVSDTDISFLSIEDGQDSDCILSQEASSIVDG